MRILLAVLVAAATLGLCACGHKTGVELSAKEKKVFDTATQEVKDSWSVALEASRTNDYAGAQGLLYGLLRQELTPEQKAAVAHQSTIQMDKFNAALQKGDPVAQAALEEMHRNPPNRQR